MVLVEREDAVSTYRQLRIAIPVLVVVLAASIAHQVVTPSPNCWLGSISAYYYTSARAVFVACLCAMGTCLIIYRGNTLREDRALNIPGFLAFVVAFIPTPLDKLVVAAEPNCKRSNVPTDAQLVAAVNNNIFALLVGAAATVGVIAWFRMRAPAVDDAARPSALALWGSAVAVVAGGVVFAVSPEFVREWGHLASAVTLFGGIVLVVLMNAFSLTKIDPHALRARPGYRIGYQCILAAMLLAIVVLGALALRHTFDHAVFWLEAALILLFGAFWVLQTSELWGVSTRDQVPTAAPTSG